MQDMQLHPAREVIKRSFKIIRAAGMVRGFVMKSAAEKRASEVQDGILRYADENGVECFAAYGAHQVCPRPLSCTIRVPGISHPLSSIPSG